MSASLETGIDPTEQQRTCVQKLAELYPNSSPLRIAVTVSRVTDGEKRLEEQTIIEFGTAREVLFRTSLPLESKDDVRVANADRSLDMKGTVVAVEVQNGRKAVAVRFSGKMRHWIIPS